MDSHIDLNKEIKRVRNTQLSINKKIIEGKFQIPIHLGIGHEVLAVSCVASLESDDCIFLTHRNIHYHIALGASVEELETEYLLESGGIAKGKLGSMNLMNEKKGNIYTSNILGNNLAVGLGAALAKKISKSHGIIWVVTGDGAIEEGAFYETLLISSSLNLPIIYIIENNGWSLATKIDERRIPINLQEYTKSLGLHYAKLEGNDPANYLKVFQEAKVEMATSMKPFLIEVELESLGGKMVDIGTKTERFVNYHSGPILLDSNSKEIFFDDKSQPIPNLQEEH